MDAIARLATEIRRHRKLYYEGTPEISDAEFDALEDRLRALAPEHPVLAEVGAAPVSSPPQKIKGAAIDLPKSIAAIAQEIALINEQFYSGARLTDTKSVTRRYRALCEALIERAPDHPVLARSLIPEGSEWPKARHEIPMGSLNKVNTAEELEEWAARCDELAAKASLQPISCDLALTEKLDGLSIEVVYTGGLVESAITRGDGEIGERITPNVIRMSGVVEPIQHQGRLSFRGEIVLLRSRSEELRAWREQIGRALNDIALRNTAAGLARANKPDLVPGVKFLNVFFYDVEGAEGITTEKQKLELIEAQGLTSPPASFGDVAQIRERYRAYAASERIKRDYEIDGLVVRANHIDVATLLGDLNNRPRAAVAFKFESEMQVSKLLNIEWQTGDTGRITPVGQVEPVRLAGAKVENASLHNIANVRKLNIGIGDEVMISRRNDVIPYIERVVIKGPNVAAAPDSCSACGQPVVEEGEYLVCKNQSCPARRIGRLRIWIRYLDLLNWGESTLQRFYNETLVREPSDLYRLTPEQITALEGFGEISARRLLDPLNEKKRIPLDVFIAALGVESVSIETARLLVRHGFDSIERIAKASVEELSEIPGLGAIKAEKIIEGLSARVDEVRRLAEVGVVPVAPKEGGPLAGLSFCFSGSHARPRKILESIVEKNGGRIAGSVTKGVTYLVLADPSSTSSKAQKAQKLGTEIIDEAMFDKLVIDRGGSLDV